jgi:chemotaxis protein methyltransferase CheR
MSAIAPAHVFDLGLKLGYRPPLPSTFKKYCALISDVAGIHLTEQKQALLIGRLSSRLRELGLPDFESYLERVLRDDLELQQMIDRICTNETSFFREMEHFQLLENELIPHYKREVAAGRRGKTLRVWSAACSTGQEPYSIAMVLARHLPPEEGWRCEILATDLSTRVLDRARAAEWKIEASHEIPQRFLKLYMLRGVRGNTGKMTVKNQLRAMVSFRQLNLTVQPFQVQGPFDLIFCRNVFIYFPRVLEERIVDGFCQNLTPGGLLLVGHAESLHGMNPQLKVVRPTIYRYAPRTLR